MASDQNEVIAFLASAASYSPRPVKVERVETHCAIVFLAGELAVKLKRAVTYSYLDFSTLPLRKASLERELEVNRVNAPEIYLRIEPIARAADGALAFSGAGETVEWVLVMRRFPQSALLSRVIAKAPLPPADARALADMVAAAHKAAPVGPVGPQAQRFARIVDQIATAPSDSAETSALLARIAKEANERVERAADLLARRASARRVRRCHGDMHLDNIVMWKGGAEKERPTLFDALEFDEDLATVDILYDLAFLLMDLDLHGARATANALLGRYLQSAGDELDIEGLAALPLFLALRSGVRAMVALQRAQLAEEPKASESRRTARRYLDGAIGYLEPPSPRLVAVGGFSGTGKSTLAAALAPSFGAAPGALHIRTDVERKAMAGVAETERLPATSYTQAASNEVYARVRQKARAALRAGHSVVLDAVFSKPNERAEVEALAREAGAGFYGLWLDAPSDVLAARVDARAGDASDATADVVAGQIARGAGRIGWIQVDASGAPDATLALARKALGI